MPKISKSGPEPAARAARTKRASQHNTAGDTRERKAGRGVRSPAVAGIETQTPGLEHPDVRPTPAVPAIEGRLEVEAAAGGEARHAGRSGRNPPTLGRAARRLRAWLRRHFGDQIESCRPMVEELLSIVDRLERLRAELDAGGLTPAERARLVRIEMQASGAFARCWRLLGLAEDAPATLPPGRPPALK
jgi:hypothetical protein